jgi:hypothetical protein
MSIPVTDLYRICTETWRLEPWAYGRELQVRDDGPTLDTITPVGFRARLVGTFTGTPGEAHQVRIGGQLTWVDRVWYAYKLTTVGDTE